MRRALALPAVALASVLVVAGCSSKGGEEGGGGEAGGLRTDVGVTAEQISLGVLTDNSGVFKDLGIGLVQGNQLWVDDVNRAGGVCGRQISLEVRDHGYKADTAKVQYPEVEPNILGFLQLLGSPINAALDQNVQSDQVTSLALSWSSEILDNPFVIIPGTTYDVEMINGLSYLMETGQIRDGDTVGHIYIEGEYGGNGLRGARYFAEKHRLNLREARVTSTDQDMTNIVTGFRGEGVKAIALTTTPGQTASAAATNAALGLNVPLVGNNPVFSPQLLSSPAAPALANLSVVASSVPYSSDVPKAQEIAQKYKASGAQELPNAGIQYGYANGLIWQQILQRACDNGDMTRAGIQTALRQSTNITTEQLVADLDFSRPGAPATRQTYIAVPDPAQEGGLRQVKPLFESPDAGPYQTPHQRA